MESTPAAFLRLLLLSNDHLLTQDYFTVGAERYVEIKYGAVGEADIQDAVTGHQDDPDALHGNGRSGSLHIRHVSLSATASAKRAVVVSECIGKIVCPTSLRTKLTLKPLIGC